MSETKFDPNEKYRTTTKRWRRFVHTFGIGAFRIGLKLLIEVTNEQRTYEDFKKEFVRLCLVRFSSLW